MDQDTAFARKAETIARLYQAAWDRYEARCLWNLRKADEPDVHDVEETAKALRMNGDLEACLLADRLREAARAA